MSMIQGNWNVRCRNRLTDELLTLEVSKTGKMSTQAKAEVHVSTQPTPFGGKHPGFEVAPADPAAYKRELNAWLDEHPDWVPPNLDDLSEEEAKALTAVQKVV